MNQIPAGSRLAYDLVPDFNRMEYTATLSTSDPEPTPPSQTSCPYKYMAVARISNASGQKLMQLKDLVEWQNGGRYPSVPCYTKTFCWEVSDEYSRQYAGCPQDSWHKYDAPAPTRKHEPSQAWIRTTTGQAFLLQIVSTIGVSGAYSAELNVSWPATGEYFPSFSWKPYN